MEKEDKWNCTSVFKRIKEEAETTQGVNSTAETVKNREWTTKSGIWRNTTRTIERTRLTEIGTT